MISPESESEGAPAPPRTGRFRSWAANGLKFAVAVLILALLKRSGQLDLARIEAAVRGHPSLAALALLLMLAGGAVSVQRWLVLLAGQGIFPGYWAAFKLTYIGFTFSLVIPGSVSGDIVKAWYVARGKGNAKKAEAVTTVAVDRLLGVYTMFLLATIGLGLGLLGGLGEKQVPVAGAGVPWIPRIAVFVLTVFAGMTLLFGVFLSRRFGQARWLRAVLDRLPFSSVLHRVHRAVGLYGADRRRAFVAALLSVLAQIPLFASIYCMALALGVERISLRAYLLILPVGFTLNSIPVAPGGIGVGEAAFGWLFVLFGSDQGANVALFFHAAFVLIAMMGLGFYLKERVPAASRLREESVHEV